MSSLPNKLIAQVVFKAGGNVLHHLVANNPKHLANATPVSIQACDLHLGNYGVDGSVVQWRYTLDGKPQIAKQLLQDIDKKKKQISWKTIQGDLLELYKNILITVHIETKAGVDFVTWTIEYELIDANKPHPVRVLNFLIEFIGELEAHIFGKEMRPTKILKSKGEIVKEEETKREEEMSKEEEETLEEKKMIKEKAPHVLFRWSKITLGSLLIMLGLRTSKMSFSGGFKIKC